MESCGCCILDLTDNELRWRGKSHRHANCPLALIAHLIAPQGDVRSVDVAITFDLDLIRDLLQVSGLLNAGVVVSQKEVVLNGEKSHI